MRHEPGWEEFAAALADLLGRLPAAEARVIVSAAGNRYVQFARGPRDLLAEVSGNRYLDKAFRLGRTDERDLVAHGWQEPHKRDRPNWQRWLTSTDPAECLALARECARVLSAVLGVAGPRELTLEAWVDGSDEPLDTARLAAVCGPS